MSKHFRRTLPQIAADALRRADTTAELDATWDEYCALYPEGSMERRQLRALYDERHERIRSAFMAADYLRV